GRTKNGRRERWKSVPLISMIIANLGNFYNLSDQLLRMKRKVETSAKRGAGRGCHTPNDDSNNARSDISAENPLYLALEHATKIVPLPIPGNPVKEIGYADDTNVIASSDDSFLEVFRIFGQFERATNSKMNLKKTKVYGFGRWEKLRIWPIKELKVEEEYFTSLGIHFSSHYEISLRSMWKYIYDKIKNRLSMIKHRNFTLYQKVALINGLIASKLWYIAHIYPLPMEYTILINKEIFNFIWGSHTNPIKRDVLYNSK
ncbi:unnamed protein product, partial [Meganyctiphanes norvegica]